MLVLSRKVGQRLVIDDNITIVITRIAGNRVQLGIEAPDEVHIMRGELDKVRRQFSAGEDVSSTASAADVPEFESVTELTPRTVR